MEYIFKSPDPVGFSGSKFPPGTNIRKVLPMASVLNAEKYGYFCNFCEKEGSFLLKCAGCHINCYCNKTCQKKDWKNGHKLECKLYPFIKEKLTETFEIGMVTLGLRIYTFVSNHKDEADKQFAILPGVTRCLNDLPDRSKEMLENGSDEMLKKWRVLADALKAYKLLSEDDTANLLVVLRFAGWLSWHERYLNDVLKQPGGANLVAIPFFPHTVFLDHSCRPNASVQFVDNCLFVRTICEVEMGDPITINKIGNDVLLLCTQRQNTLCSMFLPECNCARCSAEKIDLRTDAYEEYARNEEMFENAVNSIFLSNTTGKMVDHLCSILHYYDPIVTLFKYEAIIKFISLERPAPAYKPTVTRILQEAKISFEPKHHVFANIVHSLLQLYPDCISMNEIENLVRD